MDRLSPFFSNFTVSARVSCSSPRFGDVSSNTTKSAGHLYVIRRGTLKVLQPFGPSLVFTEPTALLYTNPERSTIQTSGAEMVYALLEFGSGMVSPLKSALPSMLPVPLSSAPELAMTADLLFKEASSNRDGKRAAVDGLAEYFVILLLRSAIDSKRVQGNVMTALSDERLSRTVTAIHQEPERPWSLEELAEIAGMSRARFAAYFLAVTGQTPFNYLTLWRIGVAQSLLKKGQALKIVAPLVGYASSGALTRAFSKYVGVTPMTWLEMQGEEKSRRETQSFFSETVNLPAGHGCREHFC